MADRIPSDEPESTSTVVHWVRPGGGEECCVYHGPGSRQCVRAACWAWVRDGESRAAQQVDATCPKCQAVTHG